MANIDIIRLEEDRLDYSNVVELEKKINESIKNNNKAILVDMTKVNYIDSRTVGLFVAFKIKCEPKNIQFGLFGLMDDIKYIFRVTNVDSILNIYTDETEATSSLNE